MPELHVWDVFMAGLQHPLEHVKRLQNRTITVAAPTIWRAIEGAIDEAGDTVTDQTWVVNATHRGRVQRVVEDDDA
jgi:hypothetical protein